MSFPKDFRWGVATAAYQIEGGYAEDGRGMSIWDTFSHEPGRISDGGTGDVACDHYHRYRQDVALMADLGINAYRFSISWPRVQPEGQGDPNPAGLAYYDRLVDELLRHGIAPVATLYHWDLPQALEDAGGWVSRDTAYRFAEYADVVAGVLGDRMGMWITLNEPIVHLAYGYALGLHAPGRTLLLGALPVGHHLLRGHGLAAGALRSRGTTPVAITHNYSPVRVAGDTDDDRAAAATYATMQNWLLTDPLLGRGYPDPGALPALGLGDTPLPLPVRDGDLEIISAPLDALGVNYYNPTAVRAPTGDDPLPFDIVPLEGHPVTAFGWPVVPDGLTDLLVGLRDRYGDRLPPIHVTENGAAYDDVVVDGRCDDPERVEYLRGHVAAMGKAIEAGVDVRGYFVWSIIDNFEWAEGFAPRFGLYAVDYGTLERRPRGSAAVFREIADEIRGCQALTAAPEGPGRGEARR